MRILACLAALLITQGIPPFAMRWLSEATYGSLSLAEGLADALTTATLLVGATGLILGGRGVYLTLLRARPWLAATLTVFVWLPLLLSAAVYAYAFLVFRAWA